MTVKRVQGDGSCDAARSRLVRGRPAFSQPSDFSREAGLSTRVTRARVGTGWTSPSEEAPIR
jgi:hypothetical protein